MLKVFELHPLFNPVGYINAEMQSGLHVRRSPAQDDAAWISLCSPESVQPLQAIATARRLGAVDERLIEEGRLRKLERPEDLDLGKRARDPIPTHPSLRPAERVRRDPKVLVDLLLSPLHN